MVSLDPKRRSRNAEILACGPTQKTTHDVDLYNALLDRGDYIIGPMRHVITAPAVQ